MSHSVNLVTLQYGMDAKIVLTRTLNMLNQSRSERGLVPFTAFNVALGHIEAEADNLAIELAYCSDDIPPQVSMILSNSDMQDQTTQLELAILTQYLIQRQSVEVVDWPLTHSQLTVQEFSDCVMLVIRDAIDLIECNDCDELELPTIDELFREHFPIKRVAVKAATNRSPSAERPAPGAHREFVNSVLSNVEEGPIVAATRVTETLESKSAAYRLAAWALAFTVALFCWPLAVPLIANNLRNGENVRTSALAIGAVGLFATLGLTLS
ncbi:hypothetical protein [uncultured Pelagimonas sp.]|uniref:hypothetical protein n=1 Tax=uncultured Pelagimonas sp. TaxID=1618102 RepID=UPI0026056091|nr:hypothetical protein [uncultured Pelagimonas sp.]